MICRAWLAAIVMRRRTLKEKNLIAVPEVFLNLLGLHLQTPHIIEATGGAPINIFELSSDTNRRLFQIQKPKESVLVCRDQCVSSETQIIADD